MVQSGVMVKCTARGVFHGKSCSSGAGSKLTPVAHPASAVVYCKGKSPKAIVDEQNTTENKARAQLKGYFQEMNDLSSLRIIVAKPLSEALAVQGSEYHGEIEKPLPFFRLSSDKCCMRGLACQEDCRCRRALRWCRSIQVQSFQLLQSCSRWLIQVHICLSTE